MQKIHLYSFMEKFGKIVEDTKDHPGKKKFVKQLIKSFLWGDIKVLGKIGKDTISKVISFGTQSFYVHTTFAEKIDDKIYVYGSENGKGVLIDEYTENEEEVFVIKTLDIEKITNFEQNSEEIIEYFFGKEAKKSFMKRYEKFVKTFENKKEITITKLIDFKLDYLKEKEKVLGDTK